MTRPSWNEYFLSIADLVATRSTCDRLHVGCVLVKDKHILTTGYNGSPSGLPHCDDVGHEIVDGHCITGDTVISKFQKKYYNSEHRTVKEIYDMWNDPVKKSAVKKMIIRSASNNGVMTQDKIVDVWKSDTQEQVFRITSKLGRSVTVTSKHKLLTPNGWVEEQDINIGDKIALNGILLCENKEWLSNQYSLGKTQSQIAELSGTSISTVSRNLAKFGIEKRDFSLGGWNRGFIGKENHSYKGDSVLKNVARSRSRRNWLKECCEICGEAQNLEAHHIDKDIYNNDKSNILTLCIKCHNLAHTPHAKRESIVFDTVVKKEFYGVENVYDITTKSNHNFVGNGIILHNCSRVIHAEINAIHQGTRHGIDINGCTAFLTHFPCVHCTNALINAGVKRIIYRTKYRNDDTSQYDKSGIDIIWYEDLRF
jgi:deoxycytidylate deaminase